MKHSRRKEAFKEVKGIQGRKRQSDREIFGSTKKFFFQNLKVYIFLVIHGSCGVCKYRWFHNQSIIKTRVDPDKQERNYEYLD